jgi:hypothetical protein
VKESEHNKAAEHIFFAGACEMDCDIVVKDAERVRMIADEIWRITGFRFT